MAPTAVPTPAPTAPPTYAPTLSPSAAPTYQPTYTPTEPPSEPPTPYPTLAPTAGPSSHPHTQPPATPPPGVCSQTCHWPNDLCRAGIDSLNATVSQKTARLRVLEDKVDAAEAASKEATKAYDTIRVTCMTPKCQCVGPNVEASASSNRYQCTDGTMGYCSMGQECFATGQFPKGQWTLGCRNPLLNKAVIDIDIGRRHLDGRAAAISKLQAKISRDLRKLAALSSDEALNLIQTLEPEFLIQRIADA